MQPVEPTLHEEKLVHIFKLETPDSVQMQPMVAHFEEGSERNLQNQEISLGNLHTHNFPHFHGEMTLYDTGSFGKV
jgi:hypothetical protein